MPSEGEAAGFHEAKTVSLPPVRAGAGCRRADCVRRPDASRQGSPQQRRPVPDRAPAKVRGRAGDLGAARAGLAAPPPRGLPVSGSRRHGRGGRGRGRQRPGGPRGREARDGDGQVVFPAGRPRRGGAPPPAARGPGAHGSQAHRGGGKQPGPGRHGGDAHRHQRPRRRRVRRSCGRFAGLPVPRRGAGAADPRSHGRRGAGAARA